MKNTAYDANVFLSWNTFHRESQKGNVDILQMVVSLQNISRKVRL